MNECSTEKLNAIFQAVFDLSPGAEVTRLRQISERNWDSLRHVSLMAAIESEFGISIDVAEALRMTSYEATRLLLEEKGL